MAVRLGDTIPVLNGRLEKVRDTPCYRFLSVRKPDGSLVTLKRRNNQQIYIHGK